MCVLLLRHLLCMNNMCALLLIWTDLLLFCCCDLSLLCIIFQQPKSPSRNDHPQTCLTVGVRVIAQRQNGGKEIITLFYHQSWHLGRQLPATQPCTILSCKPAAVGMFVQGGCVNVCILENALRKNKDGWQTITLRKVAPQWERGEDAGGVHSEQGSKLVF